MIRTKITLPLLNANEPEARLSVVHVLDKQKIVKGQLLFTVETTKATEEILSPEDGFIRVLANVGEVLEVNHVLAIIIESPDEPFETIMSQKRVEKKDSIRITKPARLLVEKENVELASLPKGVLITEEVVRGILNSNKPITIPRIPNGKEGVVVFGAGGHAKSIIEIIKSFDHYFIVGIVDDDVLLVGKQILGIPVLGSSGALSLLKNQGIRTIFNGVGGILDIGIRVKIFDIINQGGFNSPALIHQRASIEPSTVISEGVQVFANAYAGADVILNQNCIVNTNAVVSHDCVIGKYSHIAPGAMLAGHVSIGEKTLVGMGVTTAIGVRIGSGVRIGNGAIILADVPDQIVVQAGRFWAGREQNQP